MDQPQENAADAWLIVLRDACEKHTQAAVARQIDYSAAVVSQVLRGSYAGDTAAVRKAVEGALMGMTVECPVIGELPRNRCIDYQRRGFAATNPLRVQLHRACPTCTNRRGGSS